MLYWHKCTTLHYVFFPVRIICSLIVVLMVVYSRYQAPIQGFLVKPSRSMGLFHEQLPGSFRGIDITRVTSAEI